MKKFLLNRNFILRAMFFCSMLISSALLHAQVLYVNQDFTSGTAGNNVTATPISWATNGAGNGTFTIANSSPLFYTGYNCDGGNYLNVVKSTSGTSNVGQTFTSTAATNSFFYYSFLT